MPRKHLVASCADPCVCCAAPCRSFDPERFVDVAAHLPGIEPRWARGWASHPTAFAPAALLLCPPVAQEIAALASALHEVFHHPGWQAWVAHDSDSVPMASRPEALPEGVFWGIDVHLTPGGVKLIEINTNAGGAMFAALLRQAHRPCDETMAKVMAGCANDEKRQGWEAGEEKARGRRTDEVKALVRQPSEEKAQALLPRLSGDALAAFGLAAAPMTAFVAMFEAEWRLARGDEPLTSIAIVDDEPEAQFFYPEFQLFAALFRAAGYRAVVVDAAELTLRDGRLWSGGTAIDLVYNRLTDFSLSEPRHQVLRQAFLTEAAVITPHPVAYARLADKRRLIALSDPAQLARLGISEGARAVLARTVPLTLAVGTDNAERLWQERREWFFKPATGYGSKAAYRGASLTRRVWNEIVTRGDYLAQALVPPATVTMPGEETPRKFDLRAYVYAGQVQLLVARVYEGQTTNLRTAGGGLAPVYVRPDDTE